MDKHHFVFLLKDSMVVPQSLDDKDAGEIIRSLLLQMFNVSHVHVLAEDNNKALEKLEKINKFDTAKVKEVILC